MSHVPVIQFVAPVLPAHQYGGCSGLGCSCGFRPSAPGDGWAELDAHLVSVGLAPTNGYFPGTKFGPEFAESFASEKRAWQIASGTLVLCGQCSQVGTLVEVEAHEAAAHPAA